MPFTLLIVDDHSGFRAAARALLDAEGFRVVGEAADGQAGLVQAGRLNPDVALIDVQLPDTDGFALAGRLASEPQAPQVVLTSTRDGDDLVTLINASGVRGFIPKAELSGARVRELLR